MTAGLTLEQFERSWAVLRATQHGLLIIGEAVKNLPDELKATRPDIPWERIRSLGNFLRHEYASIDSARIWSIVTEHLDPLEAAARELLERSRTADWEAAEPHPSSRASSPTSTSCAFRGTGKP